MVTSVALPLPGQPYRGIEPFRYVDQCIFAVREEETWDLMSLITIYRGVLLYGESGTGKSSLIEAGLIPTAQAKGYVVDRLRVQPYAGGEIKVERISATDAGEPPYLPSVFAGDGQAGEGHFILGLDDFAARLRAFAGRGVGQPLVIFDQFEEIITLFDEAARGEREGGPDNQARDEVRRQAPAVQARIIGTLLELLRDHTLPVKLLFVFREDYLAKLGTLFELYRDILDQYLYLQPPRAEELHEIIRAPYEKLPGHFPREISEELAAKVADQLRKRSEGGAVNLTEVQIVCLMLSESRDPDAAFEAKGVRGLLQDYWEGELKKLPEELFQPATALLTHMLTGLNTRNIISGKELIDRVTEEEEGGSDEYKGALVKALQALTQTKLVRRELRDNTYFYEIVSEFLVPRIVEQKVQREAELQLRRREREAQLKREREREIERLNFEREREVARQRQSRQKWVIIALGLFLLVAVLTTLLFYQQQVTAREAQRRAEQANAVIEEERRRNKEIYELLQNLNSASPPEKRLRAIEQINTLAQANKLPPEVGSTLLLFVVTDKDPAVAKAASDLLAKAAENDPQLAQSIVSMAAVVDESAADKLPTRVSIQIESEEQRARAEQVKAALEAKGVIVPGIETVGPERTPAVTELRYRAGDGEKARGVLTILRPAGIKARQKESKYVSRAGHLELWFGTDSPPDRWFVRIDFTFDSPARREAVERAARQTLAQTSGINITFDGTTARIGPLGKSRAERLRDNIAAALSKELLMTVSLQEDTSN